MNKQKSILISLYRFFLFFLLIAVVVTVSFLLYLNSIDPNIVLLRKNAIITFINILFLSSVFCVIDMIRRKLTVEKPVRRITQSLQKITNGNFNEKIKPVAVPFNNEFNPIIESINLLTEELSGVETLRTDFISNVSHEIKTPLAVIQNYAIMLQASDLTDEKRTQYSDAIKDAASRLSDLTTNILKLSKLENQQMFPDTIRFNLSEQLCECMLNYEHLWEKKSLEIETDIDDDIYINADKELLTLVWNNLFSNAVKFTEPDGKITVRLKSDNGICTAKVSDTGCGISPEIGAHIFEKFYQGDSSHSAQGNGLGLALVKRVIDITGGEISVESELGKGSTFTVKLRSRIDGKYESYPE